MKRRVEALLAWLRAPGVVALGVLAACGAFYFSTFAPARDELAAQRVALDKLRSRALPPALTGSGENAALRRFYALFPSFDGLTAEVERLHGHARAAGLELSQGEYRLERPAAGLWLYRVTLPARGSYAQVRAMVGAVLKDMPVASLDALRFERRRAEDSQVEAQLRFTLYVRPNGASL